MAATEPTQGSSADKTEVEQTLDRIDEAVRAAEECLKKADDQINSMIERRGRIATQVQHIWNLRHGIKQMIEEGKIPDNLRKLMRGLVPS